MKKILFIIIMMFATTLFAEEITKEFSDVKELDVSLVLGSCQIQKSMDEKIHIHVEYTYSNDVFKAEFKEKKNKIEIEENFEQNNDENGKSFWTISVPDETEIEFNSATGNITIQDINAEFDGSTGTGQITINNSTGEYKLNSGTGNVEAYDCKGELELNSGTGSVKVENCQGEIEASSGTGSVKSTNIIIEDSAEFSSGTGKVVVEKISGDEFDLDLSSGTGRAELDLAGQKVEGEYIMEALERGNKIDSPYKFDNVEVIDEGRSTRVRKSFTLGKSKNSITISSGTSKAVLKK